MGSDPSLTIVLLMSHSYAWLRRTVRMWGRQSIHDRIEAVIVKPESLPADDLDPDDFLPFHSFRVHEIPELDMTDTGFAAGVGLARAPIVMLAEDHAFPEPGLAAAILAAYDADPDVVAVGPALVNGNPRTSSSEASFVVSFSGVAYLQTSREARMLAGHNASYRRDFLTLYGDDLAELYKSERMLHYDIEARGKKMILLAHPRIQHVNASRWSPVVAHAFHGGRIFASKRSRDWGVGRRLTYGLGAPLIPFVRIRRILRDLHESPEDYQRLIPRRLPAIAVPLVFHALGELIGYFLGLGDSEARYAPFELYRRDQLTPQDRRAIDHIESWES